MDFLTLKNLLDEKVEQFNRPDFIANDPISIPHLFTKKQDIEIAGLFAATFAWGQRKTIINKSKELLSLMDFSPHDFILNHKENDLKAFLSFKHRTFNATDALYFIHFLNHYYSRHDSLEKAFYLNNNFNIKEGLIDFHNLFFSLDDAPHRTKKHISTPNRKSACKRLNMFLRWMVRKDGNGVDFGIWNQIKPADLICPCDVHVDRVARQFGLIQRKQTDWRTAEELTNNLKSFDSEDPVKYDFALFGIGILDKELLL
jgi:uncharacterized protein (TIGR02757 family)